MSGDTQIINEVLLGYSKKETNVQSRIFVINDTKNLAVIGKFRDENEEYWGVSPELSVDIISEYLEDENNKIFTNQKEFLEFINSGFDKYWKNHPNVVAGEEGMSKAVFAHCVLAMSLEFSVKIISENNVLRTKFTSILDELGVYYLVDQESIFLFGRLTENQISKLNETNYNVVFNENYHLIEEQTSDHLWHSLHKSLTCHVSFYSGMLTNILEIKDMGNSKGNKKVNKIETTIIGTTFATLLGTGHTKLTKEEGRLYGKYRLMNHDLLKELEELEEYKNYIQEYYEIERKLQQEFFENFHDDDLFNDALNKYLKQTRFPVIISAAGNVLTSNDEIVYIKRGKDIENQGRLSCSVTGYMEISDPNVTFYEDSVDDDKPTINYESKKFSYSGEFSRETRAELGINVSNGEWNYLGLLVSGAGEKNCKEYVSSIGVEIIAEVKSEYSLQKIRKLGSKSIESDENENILGIKINSYGNHIDFIKDLWHIGITKIIANKDLIILLAISIPLIFKLIVIFEEAESFKNAVQAFININNYMEIIELLINLLIIILFVNSFRGFISNLKVLKNVQFIESNLKEGKSQDAISKLLSKVNGQYTYHLLTVILFYLVNEKASKENEHK